MKGRRTCSRIRTCESSSVACTHSSRAGSCAEYRVAAGVRPGALAQRAVHAIVDAEDAADHGRRLVVGAEGELPHRAHGGVQARERRERRGPEAAVLRHARRYQRVGDLQQDGPRPRQQGEALAGDGPGDPAR